MIFTIITQANNHDIGKTFTDTTTNKAALPYSGSTYKVVTSDVIGHIRNLASNQCICLGTPINGKEQGYLTTNKQKHNHPTWLTRTNDQLTIGSKAIAVFDVDTTHSKQEVIDFLRDGGITADIIIKTSSSLNIKLPDGQPHPKAKANSYHLIVEFNNVPSTSDYTGMMATWHAMAISQGLGQGRVTSNGKIEILSPIDIKVTNPSSVVYRGPVLKDGCTAPPYSVEVDEGTTRSQEFFYPGYIVINLETHIEAINSELQEEAEQTLTAKAITLGTDSALPIGTHKASLKNNEWLVEMGTMLTLNYKGEDITIPLLEVIRNKEKYEGCGCMDPLYDLNTQYNDTTKAWIYNSSTKLIGIHSFKGGQAELDVTMHPDTALKLASIRYDATTQNETLPDKELVHICARSHIASEDITLIMGAMQSARGVKIADSKAMFKKERRLIKEAASTIEYPIKDYRTDTITNLFPDYKMTSAGITYLKTSRNLEVLLKAYGLSLFYETQSRRMHVDGLGISFHSENADNLVLSRLSDLLNTNQITVKPADVNSMLEPLIIDNPAYKKNEVIELITAVAWDKEDRLQQLLDSVTVRHNTNNTRMCFERAMTYTLVGICAAPDEIQHTPRGDAEAKYELAPILAGAQGVRKSSFVKFLVPKTLRFHYTSISKFDPTDKDHLMIVGPKWVVEYGEIDSTIGRMSKVHIFKEYQSKEVLEYRIPYAVKPIRTPKRGGAIGTVNGISILKDRTGNRRWPTFEVTGIQLPTWTEYDKQQLWAQLWEKYIGGEKWWFTEEEEALQEIENSYFMAEDAIRIKIQTELDNMKDGETFTATSLDNVLMLGNNHQANVTTIGMALASMGYRHTRIKGKKVFIKGDTNV